MILDLMSLRGSDALPGPKQSPNLRDKGHKMGLPRRQRARAAARNDLCMVEKFLFEKKGLQHGEI
jgi:hypothetical protein